MDTYRGAWGLARGEGLFEQELTNDDHHDGVVWGRYGFAGASGQCSSGDGDPLPAICVSVQTEQAIQNTCPPFAIRSMQRHFWGGGPAQPGRVAAHRRSVAQGPGRITQPYGAAYLDKGVGEQPGLEEDRTGREKDRTSESSSRAPNRESYRIALQGVTSGTALGRFGRAATPRVPWLIRGLANHARGPGRRCPAAAQLAGRWVDAGALCGAENSNLVRLARTRPDQRSIAGSGNAWVRKKYGIQAAETTRAASLPCPDLTDRQARAGREMQGGVVVVE